MQAIVQSILRSKISGLVSLTLAIMIGCANTIPAESDGRVYHCVATGRPELPPNTWPKILPLEKFEYGDYVSQNNPTISGAGYCANLRVPKTAYIRYRLDDRIIEKNFDLSKLSTGRVSNKTVEFYVDEDTVEVRLVTSVSGTWPIKELLLRQ